ncbi:MAG TPA: isochorismatase family protein [Rhodoferax sp.]|nr:isochorismatase family protein [Rhodoferax sp.]
MLLEAELSQVVLVDYQARLMSAIFEAPLVLANAVRLAEIARILQIPVIGTEQNPSRLGENEPEIKLRCRQTLSKMQFSGVEEGLGEWLRAPVKPSGRNARSLPKHMLERSATPDGRNSIVIAGCEAHVCLLQTALHLLEDEFDVWVVTDACSSRTERNRDAAFDRLAGAGVELVTTEMVAFEWLRSAEHPQFKDVQAVIK